MNHAALLRSALWALLRNKTRSLLTVLGITIGIAAIICVVAIGKAGQNEVQRQLVNASERQGPGDLAKLIGTGATWEVN